MSVPHGTDEGFVGRALRRTEDARFLTGRARFVDDVTPPGALHLAILRSPHAHARVRGVDLAAARAMAGVADAFAFADIAAYAKPIPVRLAPLPGVERFQQRPLADDVVRYAGEPVAVVVADDRYRAEDALAAIAVDYDVLPPVVTVAAALDGATLINDAAGDNVGFRYAVGRGDADAAFARADYTRRARFHAHRHAAVPLETRGLAASFDRAAGRLTVWGGTKVNFFNRAALAVFLDMAEDRIEIVEPDVGGGFGGRGEFYPEDLLVPVAAIRAGRPVKWIEDRREHLLAANHSREVDCDLEIATTRDGTILALRATIRADMGAYTRTNGGVVPAKAGQFVPGPYRIADYACTVEAVMTNKTPVGTYRGPGRYEANFFRERLFDIAAAELGIDRVAFRMKNLLTAADVPYPVG
ncbi:MAG: xanthine dehydrogenase family protein molybdopterin-binding subunit, partial [Rhodospirillaceae bacterium]